MKINWKAIKGILQLLTECKFEEKEVVDARGMPEVSAINSCEYRHY